MARKALHEIKYGPQVFELLKTGNMLFLELHRRTSLDPKTLQATLDKLARNGYIHKDSKGLWLAVVEPALDQT